MLGTIVNSIVVIVGSILGIILKNGINERYKNTIIDGISLALVIIGIMGGIKTQNLVLVVISLAIGGLIGEAIDIEGRLDRLGEKAESYFGQGDSNFAKAFVNATLVFCIGAMAIVGSLESGLTGNHETLYAKSTMDGIFAVIFASSLGIGTAFAAIPIFIYQGSITLLASYLKDILTPELINEMSAIGGILIIGIGINMLNIKKIKVGNLLPAVVIPLIYYFITNLVVNLI
ncbi:MAG: DUF554 domain-containing protein [Tissierellaceae bacterium]|nr:DUF554 domain-containing protein [Tissierellaceae bacterium]